MSNSHTNLKAAHGFLLLGTKNVFGSHLPMFFMHPHAFQVIFELFFEDKDKEKYLAAKKDNPGKPLIIFEPTPMSLEDISNSKSFQCGLYIADNDGNPVGDALINNLNISIKQKILFEPLNQNNDYPENISYYLFGRDSEYHLSHILTKAPNFQQEIDVSLSDNIIGIFNNTNDNLLKVSIPSLNEKSKQPITEDPLNQSQYNIITENGTTGTIDIGSKYWINNDSLNMKM